MKDINTIFKHNTELLGYIDRAVILFREGRYDEALHMIADSKDGINILCESILKNREYFSLVSTDSITEMLEGILEAKQHKDYVLLADLYELQLAGLIGNIQELILNREDFLEFNPEKYTAGIAKLEEMIAAGRREIVGQFESEDEFTRILVNTNAELEAPLSPEVLLAKGYSVEFTTSGLLTLKAPMESGESIYLHTNSNVTRESFLMADRWAEEDVVEYIVFGFGLGYHIQELLRIAPKAHVTVFESDINVFKLYAAFTDAELLNMKRLSLVYDPDRTLIEMRLGRLCKGEKAVVHYPSLRRRKAGDRLEGLAPFSSRVEDC